MNSWAQIIPFTFWVRLLGSQLLVAAMLHTRATGLCGFHSSKLAFLTSTRRQPQTYGFRALQWLNSNKQFKLQRIDNNGQPKTRPHWLGPKIFGSLRVQPGLRGCVGVGHHGATLPGRATWTEPGKTKGAMRL